jgi:hypothetical protein
MAHPDYGEKPTPPLTMVLIPLVFSKAGKVARIG